MDLERLELIERDGVVRAQVRLTSTRAVETLWFDVDARYSGYVTTSRFDGFVVAALLVAMERGETELVVHGTVSERLLHNLQHQLMPLWRLMNPHMHAVTLRAAATESAAGQSSGAVVTGFSGGIDSFCTLADYLAPGPLRSYALTHLIFCNVGNHGRGEGGRRLFADRWNLLRDYGASVGLATIRVDSNLDDFLNTSFARTHVARNTSAALLLQGGVSKFLMSSGCRFEDFHISNSHDLAYADPAAVHLLSTESLECLSVGCEYSRVEKTRRAIAVPGCDRVLNVCNHPAEGGRNCSRCYKCLRTLSTLDLLGALDAFDQIFDLEVYRRRRFNYLMLLPGRTDDKLIREIYEFSRQPEARVPPHVRVFHAAWPAFSLPFRAARTVSRWTARRRAHGAP